MKIIPSLSENWITIITSIVGINVMRLSLLLMLLTFCICCNKNDQPKGFKPLIKPERGFVDSTTLGSVPNIRLIGVVKPIMAGNPKVINTNTNIIRARFPVLILSATPKKTTPGIGQFSPPQIVPAIINPIEAGMAEIVLAKDAYTKDENSQNFTSISKQQGLMMNRTKSLLQDHLGNIWFGSEGGGVSKLGGKFITHYTQNEGLSNNNVSAMFQDSKENIWFGTNGGGVTKYDGKYFTRFGEAEGLWSNSVWAITEDKSGNVWFGTEMGATKFDGINFTHFFENQGLNNNRVRTIFQDKDGDMWFGTQGGGVSRFNGSTIYHYTVNEGLCSNWITSIIQDSKGAFWFASENSGVSKFDGTYFRNYTTKEGLCSNSVNTILEDDNHNIWIGTNAGVSKFDGISFMQYTEKQGLCNNVVYSIIQCKSGNLWFGTFGGASEYSGGRFIHYTQNEGLPNNYINCINEDFEGNLWLATDGGGVTKYDGKSFTSYTMKEGLVNNRVNNINQDFDGNLWFGTNGGGISKFNGKTFVSYTYQQGLSNEWVTCSLKDRFNNIWFGTQGGVSKYNGTSFTNYSKREGLGSDYIISMAQDYKGNLWFGTENEGASMFDGDKFIHFNTTNGLSNNTINAILEDKNGVIWFATNGGGVCAYNGFGFFYLTQKEGLINDYVVSILEDKNGAIWFGTRFGLSRLIISNIEGRKINPELPIFKNYTFEDGFLGTGCNNGAIFEDKLGTIWIGANNMLTALHPESDEHDIVPPIVRVSTIELFNEKIDWVSFEKNRDTTLVLGNGIVIKDVSFSSTSKWYNLPENLILSYDNNNLTFGFVGINQKQNKKVLYKFKLEGLDEVWSAFTSRSDAGYGNLPAGSYIFKVKAMNSEGYWSNESQFAFSVSPPWWKTWWFYATLCGFFILSIILFIKWRERKLTLGKLLLLKKVNEQTYLLSEKNEELNAQNEQIHNSLEALKTTQSQLIQSEKMAALGQLIAGVAHEVNTPLGAIKSSIGSVYETLNTTLKRIPEIFASLLPEEQILFFRLLDIAIRKDPNITSKDERVHRKNTTVFLEGYDVEFADRTADTLTDMGVYTLDDSFLPLLKHPHSADIMQIAYELSGLIRSSQTIQIAVEKASRVVFALKSYSHFNYLDEPIKANIADGIETVLTLYHNTLKQGVDVEKRFANIVPIFCFPDELNQVWTNLIHNAIQAMKNKGKLIISIQIVLVNDSLSDVCVSINDNGSGIPTELLEKIFDPFFTTKPQGEGSGLGLDIVRKIVDKHQGRITVESEPGNTTISVFLPFVV